MTYGPGHPDDLIDHVTGCQSVGFHAAQKLKQISHRLPKLFASLPRARLQCAHELHQDQFWGLRQLLQEL